jgi:RNA-splicing ligase RtcB
VGSELDVGHRLADPRSLTPHTCGGNGNVGDDSPPVLFEIDAELGQSYIAAMQLAGEHAYAGRDVVVDKVLEILGAEATNEVHNHHNFAWRSTSAGRSG